MMIVCQDNLYHTQKLQKGVHDEDIKSKSYAFNNKVWFTSKYIKTKQNRKLELKFFRLFRILHPVKKQTYKLKLFAK